MKGELSRQIEGSSFYFKELDHTHVHPKDCSERYALSRAKSL